MGESQSQPFQLSFNRFLRVDFQGSRVTSDGGLLLVRELDERLGLAGLIQNHLVDSRTGRNTQFPLADLFRQSAYSRLAGYEDLNDATRLARDPIFRLMGSQQVWERGVALTSTLHWFETDLLAREENLTGLARLNRELVAQAEAVGSSQWMVLDMDSSESPVYGQQEQSAYNGYFESVCYHPLFLLDGQGNCLAAKLRPGKPDPEVVAKPKRRTFTAVYKIRILEEAEAAAAVLGGVGALLRREGLYSSHLVCWRRERAAGILEALTPQKRGPKSKRNPWAEENEKMRGENARLAEKLRKAEIIIEVQKSGGAVGSPVSFETLRDLRSFRPRRGSTSRCYSNEKSH